MTTERDSTSDDDEPEKKDDDAGEDAAKNPEKPATDLDEVDEVDALKKDGSEDPFAKLRASWGFPAFARDFPADEELARLVSAFAEGDYATIRTGAPALAAKTKDDAVKRAAELLRARIEPDPTSRLFFALTAALMIFLMVWWATHDGPQPQTGPVPKPPPTVEFVK